MRVWFIEVVRFLVECINALVEDDKRPQSESFDDKQRRHLSFLGSPR